MSWNYRVMHSPKADADESLSLIECYYADENATQPNGYASLNIGSFGTVDELRQAPQRMLAALDKPIVNEDELC